MRQILDWIKANPIILASLVIALLSVGGLVYVVGGGNAFVKQLSGRINEVNNIKKYEQTNLKWPHSDPDHAPMSATAAVNPQTIKILETIYGKIKVEYKDIFEYAVSKNQTNHQLIDPQLFPKNDSTHQLTYARSKYRKYFERIMGPYSPDVTHEPRLNAGMPPMPAVLTEEIEKVTINYLRRTFPPRVLSKLSADDRLELDTLQRKTLMALITQRARSLHLYAPSDISELGYPFAVAGWSAPGLTEAPKLEQIWESQVSLWVQQDIAQAIMISNKINDPNQSILTAPVKRLITVRVYPGFVGINSKGAIVKKSDRTTLAAGASGARTMIPLGLAAVGQPPALGNPDKRLPDAYGVAPSGRRSTPLYDVRHVAIQIVADFQQLPRFFNALAEVNFMTVLSVQITDIDEYADLHAGFFYGKGIDAVQVDMVIETIWLRQWTQEWMPLSVRTALGIKSDKKAPPPSK